MQEVPLAVVWAWVFSRERMAERERGGMLEWVQMTEGQDISYCVAIGARRSGTLYRFCSILFWRL